MTVSIALCAFAISLLAAYIGTLLAMATAISALKRVNPLLAMAMSFLTNDFTDDEDEEEPNQNRTTEDGQLNPNPVPT